MNKTRYRSWGISHPGAKRKYNEDTFVNRPDLGLWAVAEAETNLFQVALVKDVGALGPSYYSNLLLVVPRLGLNGQNLFD